MKITLEKTENRQAYLTVEVEPPELEEGLQKAYQRLVKKAAIPGFRKGKAPRFIVEQYLGKGALLEDAVEHMAPEAYQKAVRDQGLQPLTQPEIHLDKLEPVTYKMVVPLEPAVKLPDYHQIRLTPEKVEVKEEDIENAIEALRHQHAIWEPVERQVNSRDLVIMDIESHVGTQPFINQKDAEYQVQKESVFPMKGFAEALIGMHKGETKKFKLSFPEDYNRAELAGKEVEFKITIKEIKQEKLPEFNDDFAKQVNPEYKTAEELRQKIVENLQQNAEAQAKKDFEQKVIETVVNQAEIEFPPVMVEREIDNLIRDQMRRWQMDEKGLDEYLKSISQSYEHLREQVRPVAIRSVKQSLVLTEIARQENIQVSQEEIKNQIQSMTKDIQPERAAGIIELLNYPESQLSLASTIVTRKTIEKLVEIVTAPVDSGAKTGETEIEKANETGKEG